MSLLGVRLTALFVLFIATFLIGLLPIYILRIWSKRRSSKVLNISSESRKRKISSHVFVQILMQFGGGVLLCTIFIHLMPEVRDNFDKYLKNNGTLFTQPFHSDDHKEHGDGDGDDDDEHRIPYVELAICCGFFAVYLIEQLMHACLERHTNHNHHDHHNHHNHGHSHESDNDIIINNSQLNFRKINGISSNDSEISTPFSSVFINYGAELINESNHKCLNDHIPVLRSPTIDSTPVTFIQREDIKNGDNNPNEPIFIQILRGLVIITAFSVHSVFDGLSIGLQSTASQIWAMFFAIATHKLVIAFVVSVELYEQSKNMAIVGFNMMLFSIMSPIGILIVIITEESITNETNESHPAVIILSSLATGTLLYIVFFEILQKDRCHNLSGIGQFMSMFIGFGIMFFITTFVAC